MCLYMYICVQNRARPLDWVHIYQQLKWQDDVGWMSIYKPNNIKYRDMHQRLGVLPELNIRMNQCKKDPSLGSDLDPHFQVWKDTSSVQKNFLLNLYFTQHSLRMIVDITGQIKVVTYMTLVIRSSHTVENLPTYLIIHAVIPLKVPCFPG